MSTSAPEEVVTKAFLREVELAPFGFSGKLALITLDNGLDYNRPNTIGLEGLNELNSAIDAALASGADAIGVTGKPFIFAAGADLSGVSVVTESAQAKAFGRLGHDVFRRLGESGRPTFAFINGLALGGGLEIGLHCHYRTLASTAFVALPEVFLGLVPGWGGATLLPQLIGPKRAATVIMVNALNNNTMLKAPEALELGIVDAVYLPADFLERSLAFAAEILSGKKKIERANHLNDDAAWKAAAEIGAGARQKKYGAAAIDAPRLALQLMAQSRTATRDSGFNAEDDALTQLVMGDPFRASLYAFNLMQKSKKKVEGAPKPALARTVTRVGVVGAGLMASQLALLILRNLKVPVHITDLDQARVDKGLAWIHNELDTLVSKKRMRPEEAGWLKQILTGSAHNKDFADCDFIIEAVFEEMEIKRKLFTELEGIISTECILATNTSSLSVSKMSEHLKNPERIIGFHFFNPVAVMPLLEIARTPHTDDATTATAVVIGKELRKTMVIVKDAPAFVVNRLLMRLMGEITDALDEGTPPEVADSAMTPLGLPMSSFELLGLVGPGVALHVAQTLNATLGERYTVSPTIERLVKNGVRTFYNKDESGALVINPDAAACIEKGSKPSTADEVRTRALSALAKEARMMLDEGVVATPAEIDLCMLLGTGWPLHLGGILPYLDRIGISEAATGQRFHPRGVASLP
jgi:3-hydroxyacyl-CoA dehydrogenase/enoyl-CoA hydratase/carnithine racemase